MAPCFISLGFICADADADADVKRGSLHRAPACKDTILL